MREKSEPFFSSKVMAQNEEPRGEASDRAEKKEDLFLWPLPQQMKGKRILTAQKMSFLLFAYVQKKKDPFTISREFRSIHFYARGGWQKYLVSPFTALSCVRERKKKGMGFLRIPQPCLRSNFRVFRAPKPSLRPTSRRSLFRTSGFTRHRKKKRPAGQK